MRLNFRITILGVVCCLALAWVFHVLMRAFPDFRLNVEYLLHKAASHFIQNLFVDLSGI
jgi:hypothetical protein